MIAKNMKELEKMLMNEIANGVEAANQKSFQDLEDNLARFYTKGKPKLYERTGKLGMAGRTDNVEVKGKTAEAKVYIDDSYEYTTGEHDTAHVIRDAENGKGGILGQGHFWADTEKNIQQHLDDEMKKRFN